MYEASTVQIQFGYDPGTIQNRIKNASFYKKTIFLPFHEKKSITICYLYATKSFYSKDLA